MTNTPIKPRSRAEPWAVGLLVLSAAFALLAIGLMATGYSPV